MKKPADPRSARLGTLALCVWLTAALACSLGPSPTTTPVQLPVAPTWPIEAPPELTPSTSTAGTYYVGPSDCSDTGPGDDQTPFCSFETAAARLQPGDTLIIKAGIYRERLAIEGLSGSPAAPIEIRGESRDAVIFDGGCAGFPCGLNDVMWEWDFTGLVSIQESNFVTLRDLTVQNAIAAGVSVFGGTGIVVENVRIDGIGNAGLIFEHTSNLRVLHNDVGRTQLGWRDESDQVQVGAHEALSVVAVSDFVVANNYVHDTPKEGIDVKESSIDGEVHDNRVERACSVGIYINEAHNVRVFRNQVRRSGYYLASDGQEKLCDSHPVFGEFYGAYFGTGIQLAVGDLGELSQGRLSHIEIYQNLVWDAHLNCLEFWDELRQSGTGVGEMTGNLVYNNVFYNCGFSAIRLDDVDDTVVANNIIALVNEDGIIGNSVENSAITHNLFYFQQDRQQPVGTDYITGDPLFVDPGHGDFHPQEGSPAIDSGTDGGLPTVSESDIGAYEYGLP